MRSPATVFSDDDTSGAQNGAEAGIADAVVYLDANGNGVHDADEAFARERTARATIRSPANSRAGTPSPSSRGPVFDSAYTQYPTLDAFNDAAANFGLVPQGGPSIRGRVLIDSNGNGTTGDALAGLRLGFRRGDARPVDVVEPDRGDVAPSGGEAARHVSA